MFNFKSFFKPTLADIARNEIYRAERALLSAKINKSFCESEIAYNTARIEHLQEVIGEAEPLMFDTEHTYGDVSVRTRNAAHIEHLRAAITEQEIEPAGAPTAPEDMDVTHVRAHGW